jgi:hypothetical protein
VQSFGYAPALVVLAVWTVPGTIAWLVWSPERRVSPA